MTRHAFTVRLAEPDKDTVNVIIKTATSEHGGSGKHPAEALVNAAMHWLSHVRMNTPDPPSDWKEPDWDKANRVHDWRNYIGAVVAAMWSTFTDEQKQALAISAQSLADQEDWD